MKRKVSKIGPATLMVSLPSKWAKSRGIKAGDEVEAIEEGDRITFATKLQMPKKEVTVTLPGVKDFLGRFLCAPYVKGYDVINVRFDEREVYDKILNASKLLMGFEIVDNTEKSCKLANISTKLEQNFEVLLSRLFTGGMTFTKEILYRLKKHDTGIKNLMEYEDTSNRIALFCRRVLQTTSVSESVYSPTTLYSIVTHLEEINDSLRHIVEGIGDNEVNLNKETLDLFEKAIKVQEINFKIFNSLIKGNTTMSQIELFKEHKLIRNQTLQNINYFKADKFNAYICCWLSQVIALSHHINEELFY